MRKILVASATCGKGISREELRSLFNTYELDPVFHSLKDSLDDLKDYEGILVGTENVNADVLNKAENCKVVMKYGVGTDNIDAEACKKRNILVESMPGINSDTVAEMAFALMLSAGRMIPQNDASMKSGKWQREPGLTTIGKTLGIIGTGAIGRKLAGYAKGLQMNILGYDLFENEDFKKLGAYVPLEELLKEADFISVHVPLNNDTYHLISENELNMMKSTAVLVNTARGGIVDEDALCKALKTWKIRAAALDVYEGEKPQDQSLISLPNLITTPHVAAYAYDTLRRMDRTAAAKLSSVLNDKNGDKYA